MSTNIFVAADASAPGAGVLQKSDGTLDVSGSNGPSYAVSGLIAVVPGAHLTTNTALFGNGSFPSQEYFDANHSLLSADSVTAGTSAGTFAVPSDAAVGFARFQFVDVNNSSDLNAITITTDTPVPPAPTIVFDPIASHNVGDAPFTVHATSNSSGAITYSIASGPATIAGSTVTLTGTGSVVVKASQAAATGFFVGSATLAITVNPAGQFAGYTAVASLNLRDSSRILVDGATITFTPVTSSGKRTGFRAGGTGGATTSASISAPVNGGVFNVVLADTAMTTPENIGYAVTLTDNETGQSLLLAGYGFVQPTGLSWSLDSFDPNEPGLATATAASVRIGEVVELGSGAMPTVTNSGTPLNVVLNFGIPAGPASPAMPLAGKNVWVLGDSLSSAYPPEWLDVFFTITGATKLGVDARPGRSTKMALECYGNSSSGSNQTANIYSGLDGSGSLNGTYHNGGTTGNTLAQDLAPADYVLIWLGPNDGWRVQNNQVGAYGDAASANTLYGDWEKLLSAYLAAKPTLKILGITPYYYNPAGWFSLAAQQAIVAVMKTVFEMNGLPLLDFFATSGVGPHTWSTHLRSDGLHMTDAAFTNLAGPRFARFAQMF